MFVVGLCSFSLSIWEQTPPLPTIKRAEAHGNQWRILIRTGSELLGVGKRCPLQWSAACYRTKTGGSSCAGLEKHQPAGNLSCWHLTICKTKDDDNVD